MNQLENVSVKPSLRVVYIFLVFVNVFVLKIRYDSCYEYFLFRKVFVGEDLEKYCLLKYSGIIGHLTRGYLAALNDTKCEKFETF